MYTGALSLRSLECSTFHSKGVISGIEPAAFCGSLLLLWAIPAITTTTNSSNLCCKAGPYEWTPATASPREGPQQHLPAISCSHMSRAMQKCTPEGGGRWQCEPSPWVLFRPVIGVHHVTGAGSSDPLERTVQRNNKKLFYWAWTCKLYPVGHPLPEPHSGEPLMPWEHTVGAELMKKERGKTED